MYSPEPMIVGSPGNRRSQSPDSPGRAPKFLSGIEQKLNFAADHYTSFDQQRSQNEFSTLPKRKEPSPASNYYTPTPMTRQTSASKGISGGQHKVTWSPNLVQEFSITPRDSEVGYFSDVTDSHQQKKWSSAKSSLGGGSKTSSPPLSSIHSLTDSLKSEKKYLEKTTGHDFSIQNQTRPLVESSVPSPTKDSVDQSAISEKGSSDPDACWVTVFGFPSESADFVLKNFAEYGNVENHIIPASKNWMHIRYRNPIEARCALGKNGKVFADSLRLGVMACVDKHEIQGGSPSPKKPASGYPVKLFSSPSLNQESMKVGTGTLDSPRRTNLWKDSPNHRRSILDHHPIKKRYSVAFPSSGDVSFASKSGMNTSLREPKRGMRSLTESYRAADSLNQVNTSWRDYRQNSPLNKTMGQKMWAYMFGNY